MIVAGSNESLAQYTEANKTDFGYYNKEEKWVTSNVDLAKSNANLGRKVINGKKVVVANLRDSAGNQLYDKKHMGDDNANGKPRKAQVVVVPSGQNLVTANLYNMGKYTYEKGMQENNPELMRQGFQDVANANWGDITSANPEAMRYVPGTKGANERIAKVYNQSTNKEYMFKFKAVPPIKDKGKIINRFAVYVKGVGGEWKPVIPQRDAKGQIVKGANKDYIGDEAASSFTSEQQFMIDLERANIQ
jgi:hypothetical protein